MDPFEGYATKLYFDRQWDTPGMLLYDLASRCTQKEFVDTVRVRMQSHMAAQQPARQNPGVENHD